MNSLAHGGMRLGHDSPRGRIIQKWAIRADVWKLLCATQRESWSNRAFCKTNCQPLTQLPIGQALAPRLTGIYESMKPRTI